MHDIFFIFYGNGAVQNRFSMLGPEPLVEAKCLANRMIRQDL